MTDAQDLLPAFERIVSRFADEAAGAVARSVRHALTRMPAVGTGEFGFRSIWDEYCFEMQTGPSELRDVFDQLIGENARSSFDARSLVLREILSVGAEVLNGDDLEVGEAGSFLRNEAVALDLVRDHLAAMAMARPIGRFLT